MSFEDLKAVFVYAINVFINLMTVCLRYIRKRIPVIVKNVCFNNTNQLHFEVLVVV